MSRDIILTDDDTASSAHTLLCVISTGHTAHGSRHGGVIDSSQLEIHYSYIRAKGMARARFARTLSLVIARFMQYHYGFMLLNEEDE